MEANSPQEQLDSLRPAMAAQRPVIGDAVECLTDALTNKAPCGGPVIGVGADGSVAVKWSDAVEVIAPQSVDWTKCRARHGWVIRRASLRSTAP